MILKKKFTIAIVEDDEYYNRFLTKVVHDFCLSGRFDLFDFEIKSYLSGKKCVDNAEKNLNILILDHYLDASDGTLYNIMPLM